MNKEFFQALDILEKEKGIPKDYMLEKVEAAILGAYKREYGGLSNVRVAIDEKKEDIKVYQQKNIVEEVSDPNSEISLDDAKKISKRYKLGGVADVELKPNNFKRLSAQTAKQIIIQGIREAENMKISKEYESKRGEIITAQVLKVDSVTGNAILDTGTSTAVLIAPEQIPGEEIYVGDYIKVYVSEVRQEQRGPIVKISRTHPNLLKKLFELEIPEIQDGTIVIENVVREAGSRSKVAVRSTNSEVDPVGSCIGSRGLRINQINEELRGEKVDVIRYSEDPSEYIKAALSPAKIEKIEFDGEKSCKAYVYPDQLSLAIGKEGQNVRLAVRLTGYKIDIKTL